MALPQGLQPDPAGEQNVGNGAGGQFIGGACLSSADCASTCCATLNGAGICSGIGAQFQAGKQGCGFGDNGAGAGNNNNAGNGNNNNNNAGNGNNNNAGNGGNAGAGAGAGEAGSQNVGLGDGSQFITGSCLSDADCASGCCAAATGLCAAEAVANEGQGCGFNGSA